MGTKTGTAKKTSRPRASAQKPATPSTPSTPNQAATKAKSIYYVVYVDTYVSDTEILSRGVYVTTKAIKRLDISQKQYVRKFEGKIPDKIVQEIAETLKIELFDEDGDNRDSKELLDEMVAKI